MKFTRKWNFLSFRVRIHRFTKLFIKVQRQSADRATHIFPNNQTSTQATNLNVRRCSFTFPPINFKLFSRTRKILINKILNRSCCVAHSLASERKPKQKKYKNKLVIYEKKETKTTEKWNWWNKNAPVLVMTWIILSIIHCMHGANIDTTTRQCERETVPRPTAYSIIRCLLHTNVDTILMQHGFAVQY